MRWAIIINILIFVNSWRVSFFLQTGGLLMERRYLIILLFLCGGYLIAIADTLGICVKTIKRGGKLCSNNDRHRIFVSVLSDAN